MSMAAELGLDKSGLFATGISLVVHLVGAPVPTVHTNLRRFRVADPAADPEAETARQGFGGGADPSPYLLDDRDARRFHATLLAVCDDHDQDHHPRCKRRSDRCFRNPRRDGSRGIGGLFFDALDNAPEATFGFVRFDDDVLEVRGPVADAPLAVPRETCERVEGDARRS